MTVVQKPKQLARVVAVDQVDGMTLMALQLAHSGGSLTNVPVGKAAPGFQLTPEPGWLVVVDYMDDGSPFISDVLSTPTFDMPELNDGSFTYRFNDGTHLTIERQADDSYDVALKGDKSVTIDSDNRVKVGSPGSDVHIHPSTNVAELQQSGSLEDGGASPFDWNATDWTTVSWDTETATDPAFSTTTSATGDSSIEVLEDGVYRVTVSGLFYTSGSNISIAKRLTKNGNPLGSLNTSDDSTGSGDQVPGALHMGPMVGVSANHANASAEFSVELDLLANDTIRVETRENAETGSLYPVGTHTTFTVEQLFTE